MLRRTGQHGARAALSKRIVEEIGAAVANHPDATMRFIREKVSKDVGVCLDFGNKRVFFERKLGKLLGFRYSGVKRVWRKRQCPFRWEGGAAK